MERADSLTEKSGSLLDLRFRLMLRTRHRLRREGSLAAALTQSMALAMIGTAGAYPSWVLVQGEKTQVVLGASWAVRQDDPAPGSPLLGPVGGSLMVGIAFCCLFSLLTGSLALTVDFLGRRQLRSLAPPLHGLTAVLIACAAALGSCLLGQVRVRIRSEPELHGLSPSPGQSLFLACLACALAATATGLSCTSPARVEPARSSWDLGRRGRARVVRSSLDSDESPESSPGSSSSLGEDMFLREESSFGKVQLYGHLKKPGPDLEYPPADHLLRRRQQQPDEGHCSVLQQESKLPEKKSSWERYWDSAFVVVGNFFQGNERTPAAPQVAENNILDRGQESETEPQAFYGNPDSELQVHWKKQPQDSEPISLGTQDTHSTATLEK